MCLPNFLILGTAKAGTSTLYEWCKEHPEIYVPPHKEPFFFEMEGIEKSSIHPSYGNVPVTLEEYRQLFHPGRSYPFRGEATVFYLISEKAAQNIRKHIPDAHLFIVVRNPVERAYSQFIYTKYFGQAPKAWTFEEAISNQEPLWQFRYLEFGHYKKYIDMYDRLFPREQIEILFFDDLEKSPGTFARDFFQRLGADPDFTPQHGIHYAKSGIPRNKLIHSLLMKKFLLKDVLKHLIHPEARNRIKNRLLNRNLQLPEMSEEWKKKLEELYREDILWLEERTNRSCSHWLST